MELETEVKFFIRDMEPVKNQLADLGALSSGRIFEHNVIFDDKDKSLKKKNSLLRLRKDKKVTLTYKFQPDKSQINKDFKILKEREVEISDFDTMAKILAGLGFYKDRIYEKWRWTFKLDNTTFCLDTMPFGNFLEIEGEKGKITKWAGILGLKWEKRITLNYYEIFMLLKQRLNLKFNDITFENFQHMDMATREIKNILEELFT